jgi:hypothetical protein
MTGRHRDRVPGAGALPQRAELHVAIARHARHRGARLRIRAGEGLDHDPIELALRVQQVVRDAEPPRDRPGIRDGLGRAAAAELPGGLFRLAPWPHPERDPDHLGALLDEEGGGDR